MGSIFSTEEEQLAAEIKKELEKTERCIKDNDRAIAKLENKIKYLSSERDIASNPSKLRIVAQRLCSYEFQLKERQKHDAALHQISDILIKHTMAVEVLPLREKIAEIEARMGDLCDDNDDTFGVTEKDIEDRMAMMVELYLPAAPQGDKVVTEGAFASAQTQSTT